MRPPQHGQTVAHAARLSRHVYQEDASDALLDPIRRIEAICARHGVPPGAAALQFSIRDPRVTSTICGVWTSLGASGRTSPPRPGVERCFLVRVRLAIGVQFGHREFTCSWTDKNGGSLDAGFSLQDRRRRRRLG